MERLRKWKGLYVRVKKLTYEINAPDTPLFHIQNSIHVRMKSLTYRAAEITNLKKIYHRDSLSFRHADFAHFIFACFVIFLESIQLRVSEDLVLKKKV